MHEIRLRRPWDRTVDLEQPPVVVDVPDAIPLTATSISAGDQVRYQRGFNSPSGLAGADAICLCVGAWQGKLESVQVNGTVFSPAHAPLVVDLSKILEGFNRIEITLTSESGEVPCLTGDVVLRIQED